MRLTCTQGQVQRHVAVSLVDVDHFAGGFLWQRTGISPIWFLKNICINLINRIRGLDNISPNEWVCGRGQRNDLNCSPRRSSG